MLIRGQLMSLPEELSETIIIIIITTTTATTTTAATTAAAAATTTTTTTKPVHRKVNGPSKRDMCGSPQGLLWAVNSLNPSSLNRI